MSGNAYPQSILQYKPAIFVSVFYYLAFFQKKNGKSRFNRRLENKTKNTSKVSSILIKIKSYLLGITAVPIISFVLLFMAQWYPAWPVKYLANTKITFQATITKLGYIRKTQQTKIYLKDISTGKEFSLHWEPSFEGDLSINTKLELTAKEHWLGLYVERFTQL